MFNLLYRYFLISLIIADSMLLGTYVKEKNFNLSVAMSLTIVFVVICFYYVNERGRD